MKKINFLILFFNLIIFSIPTKSSLKGINLKGLPFELRFNIVEPYFDLNAETPALQAIQKLNKSRSSFNDVVNFFIPLGEASIPKWQIKPSQTDTKKEILENTYFFHYLAMLDNIPALNYFLEKGADPNMKDQGGNTPLQMAARADSTKAVQFMLAKGANPNSVDKDGRTALHKAAKYGSIGVVALLLAEKVNPNQTDNRGYTPLNTAIIKNVDINVIKALLEGGADPDKASEFADNIRDFDNTALHDAVKIGNLDIVNALLKRGAKPNAENFLGNTPLHQAIINKNINIIEALLERDANPNSINKKNQTPLLLAIEKGNLGVIKALLKPGGANPNQTNNHGNTPLDMAIMAIFDGNLGVINTLLENGADPTIGDPIFAASHARLYPESRQALIKRISKAIQEKILYKFLKENPK